MSKLWTPGGDHTPEGDDDLDEDDDFADLNTLEDEEIEARLAAELAQARQRLAEVPADRVVANHAMGLFELGAIHLGRTPPDLASASLAIDALGALVDGLGDRLGEHAGVLRDALAQIRLAYVQVKSTDSPA
ncbi:MAG TPA: hypothetical protein VF855_03385 [Acidimicrobiales bacterium]